MTETQKQWVLDTLVWLRRGSLPGKDRDLFPSVEDKGQGGSSVQTLWPYARRKGSEYDLSFPQAENVCDQRPPTLGEQTEVVSPRLQTQDTWLCDFCPLLTSFPSVEFLLLSAGKLL